MEKYLNLYVYDKKGMHSGAIKIKNTDENIARAIVKCNFGQKVVITNSSDFIEFISMGSYLDRCADKNRLSTLQPELIKRQTCDVDVDMEDIEYLFDEEDMGVDKKTFEEWMVENFDYSLSALSESED